MLETKRTLTMASYILLDLNGTVGTDFPDILEKLENPDNFIWVEKVQAHVKLSTLKRIKEISETYHTTVLWASLRGSDALCLNNIIDVDWKWLDLNDVVDRSNAWVKTAPVTRFASEHLDDTIIFCDDILHNWDAYDEIKSAAPKIHTIIPSSSFGLSNEQLDEIENILQKEVKHESKNI